MASDERGVPAAASRDLADSIGLPNPREEPGAYRDALLSAAGREDVRTVVPVRPEDAYLLSRDRAAFAEHVSLVVHPMATLERVHDRLRLAAAAESAGVPAPETRPLSAVDDWDDGRDRLIKSRYNVLAGAYLDDRDDEAIDVVKDVRHVAPGTTPDPAAVEAAMGHEPIVQAFVHTDGEFLFGALYDEGEPLATFQHRQIRGDSYTGGGGVYRRSMYDEDLERVARDLLAELDWHGLACIEYMRDAETGEYVLTETNPRLWQSTPSAVAAGADFPTYYWLAATGRADEIDPDYELGVGTHMLRGELGYLKSVLTDESPHVRRPSFARAALSVASSIVREPRFDYLRLDDPGPFLAGIRTVLSGTFARRLPQRSTTDRRSHHAERY